MKFDPTNAKPVDEISVKTKFDPTMAVEVHEIATPVKKPNFMDKILSSIKEGADKASTEYGKQFSRDLRTADLQTPSNLSMEAYARSPRLFNAAITGKGNTQIAEILDMLSLPGRAVATGVGKTAEVLGQASTGRTQDPTSVKLTKEQIKYPDKIKLTKEQYNTAISPLEGESVLQALARTGKRSDMGTVEGIAEDIARDPANVLAAVPGGIIARILPALKAAPAVASTVGSISSHQGENVAKGKKVSVPEIAAETIVSAIPGGLGVAAKGSKSVAASSMKAIINPSKVLKSKGANDLIEKAMEKGYTGSLPTIQKKIQDRFGLIGKENNKILQDADASGQTVDALDAFVEANKELMSNKKLTPLRDKIESNLASAMDNFSVDYPNGVLTPSEALQYKRAVGGLGSWTSSVDDMGNLKTVTDPDASAREIVNNVLYKHINNKIKGVTDPAYQKINKEFSELIPVEKAVTEALERKPFQPGLIDLLSLMGGVQGAQVVNHPIGALAGAVPWAMYRGVRSPTVMSGVYNASRPVQAVSDILSQPVTSQVMRSASIPTAYTISDILNRIKEEK